MKQLIFSSQVILALIVVVVCPSSASAQSPIVVPENTFIVPAEPSAPVVIGASNCSGMQFWDVSVAGGAPIVGTYEVYAGSPINGAPLRLVGSAPVNSSGGYTTVPVDLSSLMPLLVSPSSYYFVAKEVRVTAFGTFKSPESKPLNFRDPTLLNAPTIAPTPLFECARATGVFGHQPADRITVRDFATGMTRFVVPRAYGTYDYVGEFSPGFKLGESLFAVYETCDGLSLSPRSAVEKVVRFPGRQLPLARVARASAAGGVTSFQVVRVVNGATLRVELTRAGLPVEVVRQSCIGGGQSCRVNVPAAWRTFEAGDDIKLTQELCADTASPVHNWQVTSCYSEAPVFAVLPKKGDETISLSDYANGSWVMAYVCAGSVGGVCGSWLPLGSAFDSATINLSRPLVSGELVAVSQQVTPGCLAFNGTATSVP